ncbi:bacterio-opsin activator domain-containing protein [Halorussus halophilus]|uniref:bacterio-opsin activator domain-containing protein n=1 Tax=Halorussus halophilus TaxID=2650975 RepID=UPI0013016511|nr:bacterio-opsin activator domain-containing protein [Halorussus halophilus]
MKEGEDSARETATELEFSLTDVSHPFVGASAAENCRFDLQEMIPRTGGRYAEFFHISDADPATILDHAAAHESVEPRILSTYENGGLLEFSVAENCPAVSLAELGALPHDVHSVTGDGRITAVLPARYDAKPVVEAFLEEYPDAEFVAKRNGTPFRPPFGNGKFQYVVQNRLTERQREVLRTAYDAGYYDWPRECSGKELANELDISSATLSQHLHNAERKLLTVLFDGQTSRG